MRRSRLSLATTLSAVFALTPGMQPGLQAQEATLDGIAYQLGDSLAPVLIVEYGDFACSACGEFARDTWPALRRDFVDTGRVLWKVVPFELGFRNSEEGVRAGHCGALLGDFWAIHDALFASQAGWLQEGRPKDALLEVAARAGFDRPAFEDCYDDNPGKERTKNANRAARQDGVRATPTFFIDGFRVQGALPLELFAGLIEAAESGR